RIRSRSASGWMPKASRAWSSICLCCADTQTRPSKAGWSRSARTMGASLIASGRVPKIIVILNKAGVSSWIRVDSGRCYAMLGVQSRLRGRLWADDQRAEQPAERSLRHQGDELRIRHQVAAQFRPGIHHQPPEPLKSADLHSTRGPPDVARQDVE